ncbi:MAG: hypothetical protein ABFC34_08205 [Methanobacterium sp.]
MNWNDRLYAYRKAKIKGGPHVHLWEKAKEYYKNFDSTNLISLSDNSIKSFFDDEFLKEIGIAALPAQNWIGEMT